MSKRGEAGVARTRGRQGKWCVKRMVGKRRQKRGRSCARIKTHSRSLVVLVVVTNSGVVSGRSKTSAFVPRPAGLGGSGAGGGLVDGSGTGLAESASVANTASDTSSRRETAVVVVVVDTDTGAAVLVGTAQNTGVGARVGARVLTTGEGGVVLERLTTVGSGLTRDEGGLWVKLALATLNRSGAACELFLV